MAEEREVKLRQKRNETVTEEKINCGRREVKQAEEKLNCDRREVKQAEEKLNCGRREVKQAEEKLNCGRSAEVKQAEERLNCGRSAEVKQAEERLNCVRSAEVKQAEERLNCGRSAEVKQAEVRMHTVSRPGDRRPLSKPYRLHAHIQHTPSVLISSPTLSSLPHFARTPQTEERALEEWVAASPQRWLSILIVPTPCTHAQLDSPHRF